MKDSKSLFLCVSIFVSLNVSRCFTIPCSQVTFTRTRYHEAVKRWHWQDKVRNDIVHSSLGLWVHAFRRFFVCPFWHFETAQSINLQYYCFYKNLFKSKVRKRELILTRGTQHFSSCNQKEDVVPCLTKRCWYGGWPWWFVGVEVTRRACWPWHCLKLSDLASLRTCHLFNKENNKWMWGVRQNISEVQTERHVSVKGEMQRKRKLLALRTSCTAHQCNLQKDGGILQWILKSIWKSKWFFLFDFISCWLLDNSHRQKVWRWFGNDIA